MTDPEDGFLDEEEAEMLLPAEPGDDDYFDDPVDWEEPRP